MSLIPAHVLSSWREFWNAYGVRMLESSIKIIIIIAAYFLVKFILLRITNHIIDATLQRGVELVQAHEARVRTLKSLLGSVIGFVLAFVVIIMVIQAVGFNIVPILTTASVAGLAVGFGAQKLVRDVIGGFFIIAENQYAVGDYITIGAITGVVEELGMRITKIRDNIGRLCIIPNGDIAQVCNHSRGNLQLILDYNIAASSDIGKAVDLLNEIGEKVAQDMPDKATGQFKVDGIAQITGSSTTVRMSGFVNARYQEEVRLELNDRIRKIFQNNGIQLA